MGRRGPPPKPTALRLLSGDRKDRINRREPIPSQVEVTAPEGLTAEARVVWDELVPDLVARAGFTHWDRRLFAMFAEACADADAARQLVADSSRLVRVQTVDGHGRATGQTRLTVNPAWRLWRDSVEVANRLGAKFGLTPSDRAQLHLDRPDRTGAGKDPRRLLS